MEPAAFERCRRRLRVLEIALHDDVAAEHDLAHRLPVGGHLGHRRGVDHRHRFLERVANALAAVEPRLLRDRLVLPRRALHRHRRRPVDLGQAIDVGDVDADPRHALDHRCRRRRAGDHRPHLVRDPGAHRFGRGDQQVMDDRRRAVVVGALPAHRIEDRRRLDLAQADVRAAEHRHGPREAPAVAVEHRQRPQVAREVRHRPGRRVADRVQVRAAVMGDDALRIAGRPRGVRDGDRVPFVGRSGERARAARARRAAPRTRARRGARRRPANSLSQTSITTGMRPCLLAQERERGADRRRELAVGDQHGALAVVDLPGDQRRVEAGVERVEDRVEGGHRVMRLDHLGRVVQHHADGRAAADAERAQRGREPRSTIARLAPGVAARAVHDRLEVAEHLGAALDEAGRRQRRRSSPRSCRGLARRCP